MNWNIITAIDNGVGLQADYELLRGMLEAQGHQVTGWHHKTTEPPPRADINLFLEVVVPAHFVSAPRQWVMVNPEWWFEKWSVHLAEFDRVLCKTRNAERIFRPLAGEAVRYVGFESPDRRQPAVARQRAFIHVAGKSRTKNTEAVIEAWRVGKLPYPLLIVSTYYNWSHGCVRSVGRIPAEQLAREMNQCLFHLCPTAYEGFGHCLHEALGIGAVVITTNRPPMNEVAVPLELLVTADGSRPHHLAPLHRVTWKEIARAARAAWALPPEKIAEIQAANRRQFETGREEFRRLFTQEVAELTARVQ